MYYLFCSGRPCPPYKIVVLDEADSMTSPAQVCLLLYFFFHFHFHFSFFHLSVLSQEALFFPCPFSRYSQCAFTICCLVEGIFSKKLQVVLYCPIKKNIVFVLFCVQIFLMWFFNTLRLVLNIQRAFVNIVHDSIRELYL